MASTWFFFLMLDFFFGLYGTEPTEVDTWTRRIFEGEWRYLVVIFALCAFIIPVPMWLFRGVRRSFFWMFVTTILVNIGMWIERFMLIVPALERKSPLTFAYGDYAPSISEFILVAASFCMVALGVLVFAKFLPLMPAVDIKEGKLLRQEMKIGRADVPATIRE